MEGLLDALGTVALILLILVGLAAGWIASLVTGGNRPLYLALGVVAALATPFVLAALGLTALAAGGALVILAMGAVGAVVVLALVAAIRRS
ncbi:GlsB/YeaQ/YmgE family stress response membrane protein [Histidinibacterium lentulum]|uniref:GlsB/YeaQ/YmgE family stress response membrane protein n=1 Tax=Histidinibacterium lentulum TaxID=2480588 RepID=A0A3N2R863_9RHOB|nr:GlsB/YeaQ/YmgE family stress response membrane protein [Histidinibacterium lentulum]ROU03608.1 GlsB/YeaQ/YmgE family stress response membrane protein [Histidinibacterium lentulum]